MNESYDQVCQAIVAIADHQDAIEAKIAAMQGEVSDLHKVLMDDLIGGIKKLYGDNVRTDGIGGLKAKYSERFSSLEPDFGEVYGGDLWERLYDAVVDIAEAEREPQIMEIYEKLKAKFDKVKGVAPAAVEVAVPEGEKAVEPVAEAAPSMDDLIKKTIRKLKGRGSGIMAGARGEE